MAAKKKTTKKATAKDADATTEPASRRGEPVANVTKGGARRRPHGMDPVAFRLQELERRVDALEGSND